jgi:Ca2+-binding RTX toxin-like protein
MLTGGADADLFILGGPDPTSADRITDLVSGLDRIGVNAADYGLSVGNGLTADGALDPNWFVSGAGATATAIGHGQFVYDSKARQLLWDADGAGGAAGMVLASVAAINVNDFLVL